MRETPSEVLFRLAGKPPQKACDDTGAVCVVCASAAMRTAIYDRWQGATFTDQNKLRGHGLSDRVCEACIWAHSWVAPPGWVPDEASTARKREAKAKLGKALNEENERPPNLRLFWHAFDADGYVFGTKGHKPRLRDWLRKERRGAWWCCVPDTGQKHTLPWTRVNLGASGFLRFEERDVRLGDVALIDEMTALLTDGATKEELEGLAWSARSYELLGEVRIAAFAERWSADVGGAWWTLALWLSQRDEESVAKRLDAAASAKVAKAKAKKEKVPSGSSAVARNGARVDGADGTRGAKRSTRNRDEPAQALGADRLGDQGVGEVDGGRRELRDDTPKAPESGRAELGQLSLFG